MSHEPRPTAEALMRVATRYLAQRATSIQNMRRVLLRRMRRAAATFDAEAEAELAPLLDDVIARLIGASLLDDASYAASRTRALVAKGLPPWRISRELAEQGLAGAPLGADALDPDVQARRFAERKRLGPFRSPSRPEAGEKDLRALLRAGFSLQTSRRVLTPDENSDSAVDMNEP